MSWKLHLISINSSCRLWQSRSWICWSDSWRNTHTHTMISRQLLLTYLYLLVYIVLSSGVILYNKVHNHSLEMDNIWFYSFLSSWFYLLQLLIVSFIHSLSPILHHSVWQLLIVSAVEALGFSFSVAGHFPVSPAALCSEYVSLWS